MADVQPSTSPARASASQDPPSHRHARPAVAHASRSAAGAQPHARGGAAVRADQALALELFHARVDRLDGKRRAAAAHHLLAELAIDEAGRRDLRLGCVEDVEQRRADIARGDRVARADDHRHPPATRPERLPRARTGAALNFLRAGLAGRPAKTTSCPSPNPGSKARSWITPLGGALSCLKPRGRLARRQGGPGLRRLHRHRRGPLTIPRIGAGAVRGARPWDSCRPANPACACTSLTAARVPAPSRPSGSPTS